MKIAPFCRAINAHNRRNRASENSKASSEIQHILVHTGQHYDRAMSAAFFDALGIPAPTHNLGVGSGTQAEQVGRTMIGFEAVLKREIPDWVVVVGDVNATLACAITAKKEQVQLAHIEAGLRSFDMSMPEEINRIVTDRLADLLFTTDDIAAENLRREGVAEERIRLVGNIMIDTLEKHREEAKAQEIYEILRRNAHPETGAGKTPSNLEDFSVITLHRPSNVDSRQILGPIVRLLLDEVATESPLLWPVHPRTLERLKAFGLWGDLCASENVILLQPISYIELLRLNMAADLVFTDSGGIQEECCVLGTPCLTLRWNTERPVTLLENGGASLLVGNDVDVIRRGFRDFRSMRHEMKPSSPPLWDGHTADRIVASLAECQLDSGKACAPTSS